LHNSKRKKETKTSSYSPLKPLRPQFFQLINSQTRNLLPLAHSALGYTENPS
jgi:hypothetical protein